MSGNATTITSNTSVSNGIVLSNNETLTVAQGVTVASTGINALYEKPNVTGVSIINKGVVTATGSQFTDSQSVAIDLETGGTITNAAGAVLSGQYGGIVGFGAVSLTNAGTITSFGSLSEKGVNLRRGGVVNNDQSGVISANGVDLYLSGATLVNAGLITQTSNTSRGAGIQFSSQGGSIDNLPGGTITGSYYAAIASGSGTVFVTNAGVISDSEDALALGASGGFDNGTSGVVTGGISSGGAPITNAGDVIGSVTMKDGGTLTNSGSIGGPVAFTGAGTLINSGNISATQTSGEGVFLSSSETVINSGTIANNASYSSAIYMGGVSSTSDSIVNQTGGMITGYATGIESTGSLDVITNAGLITSTSTLDLAIKLRAGGSVDNALGGTIVGSVYFGGAAGTLTNAGSIVFNAAPAGASAVDFNNGGTLNNTGVISASGSQVIAVFGGSGVVTNSGTISASGTDGFGVELDSGTVVNSGTVVGIIAGANAVTNQAGGVISGYYQGIQANGTGDTVVNDGSISASASAGTAVYVGALGTLINHGTITATGTPPPGQSSAGVALSDATFTNAAGGVVSGSTGVSATGDDVAGNIAGTIINAGTIESTAGTAGTAISFGAGAGDLVIDPGAVFIGRILSNAGGTIELASAASAGTIGGIGAGEQFALPVINEDAGASWTINGPVSGNESITIGNGATLAFANGVTSGTTIDFSGHSAVIGLTNDAYQSGDYVAIGSAAFEPDILEVINAGGATLASFVLNATTYTTSDFSLAASGGGIAVTEAIPCFARGTRIRTLRGEIAVEALEVDDRVVVLGGGARPVRWIGRRRIDISRHPRPETVRPVRILAEAFGPGLPARDLVVSPGHALFVAGALIPAEYLVNGATIIRGDVDEVAYFHVELDHHAVLFSENLPSESYLDRGNRAAFENSAGVVALHPDFTAHDGAGACLPLVLAGEKLEAARRRLLGRVPALGFAVDDDPDLHVRLDGRRIEAVRREAGWHDFLLPAATREVRLVSHVAVPAAVRHSPDWRTLGVRIDAVFLNERFVPLENPIFRAGFHGVERVGDRTWRWSDGHGILALPPSPTPTALRLKIGGSLPGWQRKQAARSGRPASPLRRKPSQRAS